MAQNSRQRTSNSGLLSLEATLDEENKAVMAGLTKSRSKSPIPPRGSRGDGTLPYRSMLDVNPAIPRHGSIPPAAGSPRSQRKVAKRFDPADPSTWTPAAKPAPPTPPAVEETEPRELGGPQGLPKIQLDTKQDFEQNYNFDMASMPLSGGGAKSTQSQRPREGSSSSAKQGSTERHGSKEVKTPTKLFGTATTSGGMLSPDSPQSKPRSGSGSGSAKDGSTRRLSNRSNKSSSFSTIADGSDDETSRVMADDEADEDAVAESSEDEQAATESDEESPETDRGRSRDQDEESSGKGKDLRIDSNKAPQSLGVRSMLEPVLSPSVPKEPSGEVHPPSSFGRSGPTAADFADEEDEIEQDIKKAKTLGMIISPLDDSIPERHVRMIIRGDWARFQDETENNSNSSPRTYLACTDLSTEASYALEWTVGTMLRDGDTLLAIYAIEDENAPKEIEGNAQIDLESVKAAQETNETMASLTRQTTNLSNRPTSKFVPAIDAPSAAGSANLSSMPKRVVERMKAIDEITQSFLKLVRKTPLQIRCMVEVIHCKSPKHLLLNAIDTIEPTLCVVGTRGRSSLKGVLLGSFSNYLVTKSSVPVMVARKRLKKPAHAKVNAAVKMTNNLSNPLSSKKRRDLASARID